MKTGLFFGSFNPVHIGHLALANYFIEYTDLEELWFVVSPHNPLKQADSLLDDELRLEMMHLAIEDDPRFTICDIEFRLPKPSFTFDTLTFLSNYYPEHSFILLMGTDGLNAFHRWKNYEQIIENYHRYLYPRHGDEEIDFSLHKNSTLIKHAPRFEISSSFIRDSIRSGKDIRHFVPEKVYEFIEHKKLYRT